MKKSLFLVICLLSFTYLKAQTYTSGHLTVTITDTNYHDSTSCTFGCNVGYDITVDSSYTGETVNIVDTSSGSLLAGSPFINTTGAPPWIFSTGNFLTWGMQDFYLTAGVYFYFTGRPLKIVCGLDTVYADNNDSILVNNPCIYSSISGRVYIDYHADCTFDSGDVGIAPSPVSVLENFSSPSGTGWPYGFGSGYTPGGYYSFGMQQSWMVNYNVFLPPYYAFIFPASPCFSGSYTFTTLPQSGVDFPLECTSHIDVQCNALSPASVRLHRAFYMEPYVTNTGCDSASGELTFIKDSRVIYDSALSIYPADTVRGDTLIWNYSGLTNLSNGAYWNSFLSDVYLTLDSTVIVGDTLCFSGYTNIMPADIDPTNNIFSYCIPVVYSYDPNLKEVSPKGTGPQGYIPAGPDTLTYNLHFQNTGSDVADNVSITDTLDSHINASTLKILGTSHSMTPHGWPRV